jgi:D-3-phosphoglycerate dehydrogenase
MQQVLGQVRSVLDDAGLELVVPQFTSQHLNEEELLGLLPGCIGIIAGDDQLTARVMVRVPELRTISKWGVGVDAIDVGYARGQGISVTNTPGMFDDEVADVALGYLLLLARQLHRIDADVRAGRWSKPAGRSLAGMSVGVVGLGGIGSAFARRALVLGMTVIACDPASEARHRASQLGIDLVSLDDLVRQADVVSLMAPLTPLTRHLLDADRLSRMKPGSYLVNTARGPLIDQDALVNALRSGHISAAALDVFEEEPLPSDHPLTRLENVVLGSHNASNTHEANLRTSRLAALNLLRSLGKVR